MTFHFTSATLGFRFSADELLLINNACASSEAFMHRYGQPASPVMLAPLSDNATLIDREMDYNDALVYLSTSDNVIHKAVKNGLLPRHTHPGHSRQFFFWRSDLDKFNATRGKTANLKSPTL